MLMVDYCAPLPGSLGWAVNLTVLWTCASVLIAKKLWYEADDRLWRDFILDGSRQFIGAMWALLLSAPMRSCGGMWTTTLLETTLGVFVEYLALVFLSRLFRQASGNVRAFATGEYCDSCGKFSRRIYTMQLVLWLMCVTIMRFAVWSVASSYDVGSEDTAVQAVSWNPRVERVLVLLITPCLMRGFQVWLTDDFIKKGGAPGLMRQLMKKMSRRPQRRASRSDRGDYVAPKVHLSSADAPPSQPKEGAGDQAQIGPAIAEEDPERGHSIATNSTEDRFCTGTAVNNAATKEASAEAPVPASAEFWMRRKSEPVGSTAKMLLVAQAMAEAEAEEEAEGKAECNPEATAIPIVDLAVGELAGAAPGSKDFWVRRKSEPVGSAIELLHAAKAMAEGNEAEEEGKPPGTMSGRSQPEALCEDHLAERGVHINEAHPLPALTTDDIQQYCQERSQRSPPKPGQAGVDTAEGEPSLGACEQALQAVTEEGGAFDRDLSEGAIAQYKAERMKGSLV
mmetsp:Transcript_99861/g.286884  ORF Transcript_99861/g.286884 Transcript_99861/m.286884 type:complete len:510 (-) Transcript_99861:279-1808(-)